MVNCFFLINNPKLNFQFSFPKAIIIGKEIIRTPSGVQQHFPLLDKKNDFKNAGYQFKIETQTLINMCNYNRYREENQLKPTGVLLHFL